MNKELILNWIKANPIIVACLAVMVLALLSFYYPSHVWADAFRSDLMAREDQIGQINSLKNSSLEVPSPHPDDPPVQVNTVVNAETVNKLRSVFQQMESEYTGIFAEATKRNKEGHEPMLTGLFPVPLDDGRLYEARPAYTKLIAELYSRLSPGTPPSKEQVAALMKTEEDNFRRAQFATSGNLTQQQTDELVKRQSEAVQALFRGHAAGVHIYTPPVVLSTTQWDAGAFQVGDWAKPSAALRPMIADIWEGQMEVWIQQDIVAALVAANAKDPSVTTAPVKRLVAMFVKPGYVGLTGAAATFSTGGGEEGSAPTAAATATTDPNQRLVSDYNLSPTGRKSNGIYDVRHAVLTIYVDGRKIPQVLNALGQVNFMTVLGVTMTDVNEYTDMTQGYYYGHRVDVVKLDITLETIWMRSWIAGHESREAASAMNPPVPFDAGLMPDEVRAGLGLSRRGAASAAPAPAPTGEPAPAPANPE